MGLTLVKIAVPKQTPTLAQVSFAEIAEDGIARFGAGNMIERLKGGAQDPHAGIPVRRGVDLLSVLHPRARNSMPQHAKGYQN